MSRGPLLMRCVYYKVRLIFSLSTIKIRLFNLLEFEIEQNDRQHFKKKNNTRDLESDQLIFKFGVLQRVRHNGKGVSQNHGFSKS